MSFHDLRQFLDRLSARGQLLEVDAPIDPELESTALSLRALRANGPALLLHNPTGSAHPLLGNLFKQTARSSLKKELVILLKPTIVRNGDWSQDILQAQERIQAMQRSEGGSASAR